ncbi:MAG: tetratricopeptide repeat protein [Candidatus Electrothrix sp. AR3]|nr:tetratricopeptide repeat protein [Candidatus Electrothrix sp. AR3]
MKKEKCSICESKKAKRKCSKDDSMICSLCCANNRSDESCSTCFHFNNAQNYNELKQIKKKHFIIAIEPEVEQAVNDALTFIERREIKKGQKILFKLLQEHPKNYMVHYGIGVSYAFAKNNDKAIEFFQKAIEIFPYFVEAYFNLATAYQANMDFKNAVANFTTVCELGDPDEDFTKHAKKFVDNMTEHILETEGISLERYCNAQEIFEESHAMMAKKKWELAKKGFEKVLEIQPNHVQSLGNIGICYGGLGEQSKSINFFDQALALDPDYEPALHNKKLILSGVSIADEKITSVQYYKEQYHKENKQSFIRNAVKKIIGK